MCMSVLGNYCSQVTKPMEPNCVFPPSYSFLKRLAVSGNRTHGIPWLYCSKSCPVINDLLHLTIVKFVQIGFTRRPHTNSLKHCWASGLPTTSMRPQSLISREIFAFKLRARGVACENPATVITICAISHVGGWMTFGNSSSIGEKPWRVQSS